MIDDNVFRAPDITDSDYEDGVYNALESITFEEGSQLNTIKGNVFRSQYNLKSIVLPDTLVSIGNAFGGCTNLTSINIPRDLTTFGDSTYNPIRLCTSLKEITIDPNNTILKL